MASLASVLDPGDLFGFQQDERISRANEALAEAQKKAEETSSENRSLYGKYKDEVYGKYGAQAEKLSGYLKELEDLKAYDPGQFDPSTAGSVEDYYSKAAGLRSKNAMNAIRENSDMFSSDYIDAVAAKQQALASEEWDKAYDRYMQNRQQSANEWQMNANAGQQAYSNQYNKSKDLMTNAQNAQDNLLNAYGNYVNNIANQNNIDTTNYANYVQGVAANQNSEKGLLGRLFG